MKIVTKVIIYLVIFVLGTIIGFYLYKWIDTDSENQDIIMHQPKYNFTERSELQRQAILNNNLEAYNKLFDDYYISGEDIEFLYIALLMANRNNYPKAYYDTYQILESRQDIFKSQKISDKTPILARYYLILSHEHGYKWSKFDIEKKFANGVPSSSDYLKEKLIETDSITSN